MTKLFALIGLTLATALLIFLISILGKNSFINYLWNTGYIWEFWALCTVIIVYLTGLFAFVIHVFLKILDEW